MTTPPTPPAATPPAATPPATGDTPRTFTQDEVTRLATSEKQQGERAARRQVAEALGLDPEHFDPADVKKILDAQKHAEQAHLSEAEKKAKEAADDRAAAATDRAAAATERLTARKERALLLAGVPTGRALGMASSALGITLEDDEAAVTSAVAALKTEVPALFGTAPPATPPAPSGEPAGTPPRQTPTGDAMERGRQRALKLAPPAVTGSA